jgi:hypothetical protein
LRALASQRRYDVEAVDIDLPSLADAEPLTILISALLYDINNSVDFDEELKDTLESLSGPH